MKQKLLTVVFAAVLLHASDVNVDGRWNSPTDMKNHDGDAVVIHMLLKQDRNKFSGGVWTEDHDADHPRPIQNGKIDGDKLRFEVPQQENAVVAFELEVNGDVLNGTAKFQGPDGQPKEIKLAFKRVPAN